MKTAIPCYRHLKYSGGEGQMVRRRSGEGCACTLSHVLFFVTPRTVAHQAHLSMEFFRQEYWNECHFLFQDISQPKDQTWVSWVSCIGRKILYDCATWEGRGVRKKRGGEKKMTKREEREEKGRWRERRVGRKAEKSKCTLAK